LVNKISELRLFFFCEFAKFKSIDLCSNICGGAYKLIESEIKLMLKLQLGQILTMSKSHFEHAFNPHTRGDLKVSGQVP